jgi:hypothetical protein
MSFLFTQPQALLAAATDLAGIGSTLNTASSTAAAPTTGVRAAGADEVSAAVAALFGAHGQRYQSMSAQAAALHSQFVQAMDAAGAVYDRAEEANVSLQSVQL